MTDAILAAICQFNQ